MMAKGGAALAPINTAVTGGIPQELIDEVTAAEASIRSGVTRVSHQRGAAGRLRRPSAADPGLTGSEPGRDGDRTARAGRRHPRRPADGHHQALRGPPRERRRRPRRRARGGPCLAGRERRRQDDPDAHPLRPHPCRFGHDRGGRARGHGALPQGRHRGGRGHGHAALLAGPAHDRGGEPGPGPRRRACALDLDAARAQRA